MSPACLYDIEDSTQASPLIGYAFDYYPIYGGYGHADPMDTNSAIVRLLSSYRLRAITDRTTLPDGTVLPPTLYGPSFDSVPLGGYMEDFEYVEGLGRTGRTQRSVLHHCGLSRWHLRLLHHARMGQ